MWWDVLKEAKTPAAIEHKRKYETQYESTPARKKYRRELERERRKRGVAGKGGKDMSHTKTGKIVPEDPRTNRARSHPSVGSTLKMVIVKAPMWDAQGNQVTGDVPKQMPDLANERKRQKKIENIAIGDRVTDSMAEAHQDLLNLTQYPFGSQWEQQMNTDNPNRYLYQDKRLPVRAIVDVKDGVARIPTYATPLSLRGKGHGTEGLRNLKEELREMGINQMHPVDVMPSATGFWDKMRRRGVTSPDVIKAPQMNLDMESAQCASCNAMVDGQQAFATNRIFGETVCLDCIQREQERINQQNDMMYHSEPTDRTQQMTLDGQIAPSTRTTIPVEDPAAVRQRIDANTQKLRQKLEPRTNKQFAQDAEKAKQRRLKLHAMRAAGNTTLPHQ
jgi:hypothetical protein